MDWPDQSHTTQCANVVLRERLCAGHTRCCRSLLRSQYVFNQTLSPSSHPSLMLPSVRDLHSRASPSRSLARDHLPARPHTLEWNASEGLKHGRLLWIPMTVWIVGWLLLVRVRVFRTHCFPRYQDTHATLLIASHDVAWDPIKRLASSLLWLIQYIVPRRWLQRAGP